MSGRSCPVAYRYSPDELATGVAFACETLYVVGGLYGNTVALEAVLEQAERERYAPTAVVFNGDFHWLDVDPEEFRRVTEQVVPHHAIQGNVEAELAAEDDAAGCGCAYPEYIDDATVARSNAIMARLREGSRRLPQLTGRLAGLPRHLTVEVGGERIGIVHGDPESLAGWRLALEAMEPGDPILRRQIGWSGAPTTASVVADWFRRADVRVFCSSHTGLPYAQDFLLGQRRHLVINSGAAGLANFRESTRGVITRLSCHFEAPAGSLYGIRVGPLRCDAMPVDFDLDRWTARFLAQWPRGSPGHDAYLARITRGTQLRLQQAARGHVNLAR
jgi:Calcineurin-like phosphoesterase superfamily domain